MHLEELLEKLGMFEGVPVARALTYNIVQNVNRVEMEAAS